MARKKGTADNWWSQRWISVLDSYGWHNRLARGKSYARKGMVLTLDLSPGAVAAKVSGSRPRPYSIKIKFGRLTDGEWDSVFRVMSSSASYSAFLLAGEMPGNIEDAFKDASISLFPSSGDINMQCSCPDWALPCKHIAAVFYVLGERFNEDPFLLFQLRGCSKETVIEQLRSRRVDIAREGAAGSEEAGPPAVGGNPGEAGQSLDKCIDNYWSMGQEIESFKLSMSPPRVNGLLLKILGAPGFVADKMAFISIMEECYREVSKRALEAAYALDAVAPEE